MLVRTLNLSLESYVGQVPKHWGWEKEFILQ